jgi:hypothetical protein
LRFNLSLSKVEWLLSLSGDAARSEGADNRLVDETLAIKKLIPY